VSDLALLTLYQLPPKARLLKTRLDSLLVETGRFPSRARARAAIEAGLVTVNGAAATKPAQMTGESDEVGVKGDVHAFVSRGGVKLEAALRAFEIRPAGMTCLDLGASTGGFTDVLLRAGAAKVFAVDVGRDQLHEKLLNDSRVWNLEKTHAKDLSPTLIDTPPDLIVCDLSFISLAKAIAPALALASTGAALVALFKPQFEMGRAHIGKGGLVTASTEEIERAIDGFLYWLERQGWRTIGVHQSPIDGGDGNREFLIGARKT
jgi:23S rRNA (cytidine1920-2'-O)/16S rRNA (cytidine1409-2'-O)-methyltransferase